MHPSTTPSLVITLGDPLSINIKILSKILSEHQPFPTYIVGSYNQWLWQTKEGPSWCQNLPIFQSFPDQTAEGICFINKEKELGQGNPKNLTAKKRGIIARSALEAIKEVPDNRDLAVLTCPINKKNCHLAGFPFPGQTEYFESIWQGNSIMIMKGGEMTVGLVTNHLPLKQVVAALSSDLIVSKGMTLLNFLRQRGNDRDYRIGVCGVNPHAGESGICGTEEGDLIKPAIDKLNQKTSGHFIGPISADTAFYRCLHGEFDALLAMFHDQALTPIKTMYFEEAINITGGLQHFRCSPDHGPAADLFDHQQFSIKSMKKSLEACWDYLFHRQQKSL